LLLHEADMRDLAVNEEVEIDAGTSGDVQVRVRRTNVDIDPARDRTIPLLPGLRSLRYEEVDTARQVEVSNARDQPIDFEVRLQLQGKTQIIRADHPVATKKGRPVFHLQVPAHGTVMLRFQVAAGATRVTQP
jgi:hypothetical protein